MNFLGHSSISLIINKKTTYGNFAGDFYKGRLENFLLPSEVKDGLFLHRRIDSVSDEKNLLVESIDSKFGIFKGVIADIFIDHFLALEWENLFNVSLESDIKKIYMELDKYSEVYPHNFLELYNWIKLNNILYSYKDTEGIEKTFYGISKRVRRGSVLIGAYEELLKKYDLYHDLSIKEYKRVFELIKKEQIK